jgi:hypothetical protein
LFERSMSAFPTARSREHSTVQIGCGRHFLFATSPYDLFREQLARAASPNGQNTALVSYKC